ncbi:MAG: citramalate synthase [Candidatus Schekmanbacteria bacterium]|nr:citramalate synthase [Candidatus Schekmanbacteria bacterium]
MVNKPKILIYDTTLRDGTQGEGISLSVEDKLRIAGRLDELGVHYIEGGWPHATPKDLEFFRQVKNVRFKHARPAAFGSTRQHKNSAANDPNLNALLEAGTPVVTIFGKSWDLHVTDVLNIPLSANLDLIADSIAFLKAHVDEVMYDAEHFFDAYKANPEYALQSIKAAAEAGADWLVLCDTNGGTLPHEVAEIVGIVRQTVNTLLGIHTHNDADTAVASSIMAVMAGVQQIQGTINGLGERCGNANLCSIIPNLKLKLGLDCISDEQLKGLTDASWFISEVANLRHQNNQPYVGESAFAHKAGIHVGAVQKNRRSYEHISPELVGNSQRILISELSGRGNIVSKAMEYQLDLNKDTPEVKRLLKLLKDLEHEGYQFEAAEASFELMLRNALGLAEPFFELEGFRVIVERRAVDERPISEATIKVKINGVREHTAAEGNGPVSALDKALRLALEKHYPAMRNLELVDYKVRILNEKAGTAAKTRVLIETSDGVKSWGTVGVSANIIEASWQALVDSINYKLLKDKIPHK